MIITMSCAGEADCTFICNEPGVCEGIMINSEESSTTTECQDACTNFIGCNYYSYDPTTKDCIMFDTCPALDAVVCAECVSGTPGCKVETQGNAKCYYTNS